MTYWSPVLRYRGCDPSVGQFALSLKKPRVSQTIWKTVSFREVDYGYMTHLQHQLRDLDRVGIRAGEASGIEPGRPGRRIADVVLVVWAIQVLAIPASAHASATAGTYV